MNDLVTVIIPAFNAERHIEECLISIKTQTYVNLEIIVLNDGSTDTTDAKIRQITAGDSRFRYIVRENRGLVATLNELISTASGVYIARMDADDVALPTRIFEQVRFLKAHPNVAVVGSRVELINVQGGTLGYCRRPVKQQDIQAYFFYGSPLAHPSVMFNLKAIPKSELHYSNAAYPVEDLELWLRISQKHVIGNIQAALLKYRVNPDGISSHNQEKQIEKGLNVRLRYLGKDESARILITQAARPQKISIYSIGARLVSFARMGITRRDIGCLAFLKLWLKTVRRDLLLR